MLFKQLAKDSAIYGGADLVSKTISFFTFPIVAAVLAPADYGLLELVLTTTAVLGIVMNVGLNNAVQRFYWDDDGGQGVFKVKVVSSGFAALAGFGIGILLLGSFVLPLIIHELQSRNIGLTWLTLWSALALMVFTQLFQYNLDVTRLHFAKWRFFALALFARSLSLVAGLVAVVKLDFGIQGLVVAQLLVMLLAFPFSILAVKKDFLRQAVSMQLVKKLVKFGYPFIHVGLAFWLFGSMDRYMLSYMSSVEEVGIYSVSFRFASLLTFVSGAFGQAWSPVAFKVRQDHPELYRKLYGDVLLVLFFVMLSIGSFVGLFAGEAMGILMPDTYSPSVVPLIILCFGVALQATQQVTAVGISIEEKTYLFARLSWLTAGANFILNLVLIPKFGAAGAALATLLSYLLLTSIYFYFTQKLHPMKVGLKHLFVLFLLAIGVFGIAVQLVSPTFQWSLTSLKAGVWVGFVVIGSSFLPFRTLKIFHK
jgi:O-antigen/teichoic acid export membrane protein